MSMNLMPYRDYDEHNVVNLYTPQEGTLTRGTFVSLVSFDPDNHSAFGAAMPNLPSIAFTYDYVVNAKCKAAITTTGVLGLILKDVKYTLDYPPGQLAYLADPVRLAEQQVVPSGRAVPILTKGVVEVQGFTGAPYPGAAAIIMYNTGSGVAPGTVGVAAPGTTPNVGMWLSQSGKDGGAILKVNCG